MKLFYWDVNLVLTSPEGNRYQHQTRVQAGTMQTAKAVAVLNFQERNPAYTIIAKEAYRGGSVQEAVQ